MMISDRDVTIEDPMSPQKMLISFINFEHRIFINRFHVSQQPRAENVQRAMERGQLSTRISPCLLERYEMV